MAEQTSELHWHYEPYPLMVGFGAGFFLPWAFMFHFVYGQGLFAIITLALGVLLLLAGGVGWVSVTVGTIKDEGWSPTAMLIFIGTEIMTIIGVLAGYWTMRQEASIWPPAGTPEVSPPVVATLILISSSFTAGLAHKKQLAGNAVGFANMTLLSVVIWIIFAVMTGMYWMNLMAKGLSINTNAYSTAIYGLTGIHFAHLVFGIVIMLLVLLPAYKGRLSPSYARSMSMYVDFVNVLGVVFFAQLYWW